jgi:hypothetical protein
MLRRNSVLSMAARPMAQSHHNRGIATATGTRPHLWNVSIQAVGCRPE